jgi:hypothetical protein
MILPSRDIVSHKSASSSYKKPLVVDDDLHTSITICRKLKISSKLDFF